MEQDDLLGRKRKIDATLLRQVEIDRNQRKQAKLNKKREPKRGKKGHEKPDSKVDSTPKHSGEQKYRNRAAERRLVKSGESASQLASEYAQIFNGSEEHAHLVKGLDLELVAKRRKEIEQQQQQKHGDIIQVSGTAGQAILNACLNRRKYSPVCQFRDLVLQYDETHGLPRFIKSGNTKTGDTVVFAGLSKTLLNKIENSLASKMFQQTPSKASKNVLPEESDEDDLFAGVGASYKCDVKRVIEKATDRNNLKSQPFPEVVVQAPPAADSFKNEAYPEVGVSGPPADISQYEAYPEVGVSAPPVDDSKYESYPEVGVSGPPTDDSKYEAYPEVGVSGPPTDGSKYEAYPEVGVSGPPADE